MFKRRVSELAAVLAVTAGLMMGAGVAQAAVVAYTNGFEVDTWDWDATTTRVASGTNDIVSASGGFHAQSSASGSFTRWGGYNFGAGNAVPTVFHDYSTALDIYLDIAGGWANDTRFDFSSAINNDDGTHKRDFIFNAGFYNDSDGSPGSGNARFVISASNNSQPSSAFAKNPDKDPIAILTSGWYTFEHRFYDDSGVLAVDMSIRDASGVLVNTWTLSDSTDLITGIGGNRYGWFDYNQFSPLAFDNAIRFEPTPPFGFGGFFQPVGNDDLNIAKAGQTIPVKWQLFDGTTPVSDPASFIGLTSRQVNCTAFTGTDPDVVETYTNASGLLYLGDGTWQFNWKTAKAYAGQCRIMTVTLSDGSTHSASFQFK